MSVIFTLDKQVMHIVTMRVHDINNEQGIDRTHSSVSHPSCLVMWRRPREQTHETQWSQTTNKQHRLI